MTPNDEEEEHMSEQHIYNDNPIGRQSVTNLLGFFLAEWQTSIEMSEKCPLCHLKMSVLQAKIAIQQKS